MSLRVILSETRFRFRGYALAASEPLGPKNYCAKTLLLCTQVDLLLSMLVPLDIGRDIELCLTRGSMAASGRAEMERTKLIRLFPVND
ncbi:hypothetical protein [Rhizobium leguminosarum]|uniref:hypothetical protein n=1 Tax=Rhizobium leguminosarum TaxID=384 RepID=UPI0028F438D0|nr:hypothetical protein [Rhizobium leguminosarum]MBY5404225.1 hypothetical protein [Rhizobium leguminosarum]